VSIPVLPVSIGRRHAGIRLPGGPLFTTNQTTRWRRRGHQGGGRVLPVPAGRAVAAM